MNIMSKGRFCQENRALSSQRIVILNEANVSSSFRVLDSSSFSGRIQNDTRSQLFLLKCTFTP